MAVSFDDFNEDVMRKLFPQTWEQMKAVPVKEKAHATLDLPEPEVNREGEGLDEPDAPEPKPEVSTPELSFLPEEPEPAEPDGGQTVYRNPHRGTWKGNRFEMRLPDPLPPDQHPQDLDELLIFLDECGITVTATADGFIFTGGAESQRQRAELCLDHCPWTYGNLRHYLKGELKELDGRIYVHPKLRNDRP